MLQNEYLDAKIGVDTAENEPSKVCLYVSLLRFYLVLSDEAAQLTAKLAALATTGSFGAVTTSCKHPVAHLFCTPFLSACALRRSHSDR
jgi:hypothetical protein